MEDTPRNLGDKDLHYGKDGNLTGPDHEHAEVSIFALHLLQAHGPGQLLGGTHQPPGGAAACCRATAARRTATPSDRRNRLCRVSHQLKPIRDPSSQLRQSRSAGSGYK